MRKEEVLDSRVVSGSEISFQGWIYVSLYDAKAKTLMGFDEILAPVLGARITET